MIRLNATLLATLTLTAGCGIDDPFDPSDTPAAARATVLAPIDGDDQIGGAGAELPEPLVVRVLDQFGDPVEDVTVAFSVLSGGGSIAPVTTTTDAQGRASARWTLGAELGAQQVEATTDPATTIARFSATAVAGPPATIELGNDTLRFDALGDTARVVVNASDEFGHPIADPRVTWTSDNPDRATVNGAGLVTATGNGTTRIIASSGDAADTVVVIVDQIATLVLLDPAADTLIGAGDTVRLRARVFDANGRAIADAAPVWATSDADVATVGTTGLVTAVDSGHARVSATFEGVADTSEVVVRIPAGIAVVPAADTIAAVGDTTRLTATVTDAEGDAIEGARVVWASLDTAIARVDAYGRVTARDTGTARIVASIGAFADTAEISVAPETVAPALPRSSALSLQTVAVPDEPGIGLLAPAPASALAGVRRARLERGRRRPA